MRDADSQGTMFELGSTDGDELYCRDDLGNEWHEPSLFQQGRPNVTTSRAAEMLRPDDPHTPVCAENEEEMNP